MSPMLSTKTTRGKPSAHASIRSKKDCSSPSNGASKPINTIAASRDMCWIAWRGSLAITGRGCADMRASSTNSCRCRFTSPRPASFSMTRIGRTWRPLHSLHFVNRCASSNINPPFWWPRHQTSIVPLGAIHGSAGSSLNRTAMMLRFKPAIVRKVAPKASARWRSPTSTARRGWSEVW